MTFKSRLGILAAVALVAGLVSGAARAQMESGCAPLVRPIGSATTANLELALPIPAPDPDIAGSVALTYNPAEEPPAQKLGVQVTAGANFAAHTYELFIQDALGVLISVGLLEWDGSNELVGNYEIDQDSLGFAAFLLLLGADDISQLQGRLLEIREDGSTTVLIGAVPLFGSNSLTGSVDPRTLPRGTLEMQRRGAKQTIKMRVINVRVLDTAYYLFVETAVGSELYSYVANLEPADRRPTELSDVIRYRVDTTRGESLPLNVASLDDLVGRRLFILDDDLEDVVEGVFPALRGRGAAGGKLQVSAPFVRPETLVADSSAFGSIRVTHNLVANETLIEFYVRMRMQANFAAGQGRVLVELVPGSRVFNEVGWLYDVWTANKIRAKVKIDMGVGEPLPLGESTYAALEGREVQIRDPGGYLYLRGILPALPVPGVRPARRSGISALTNMDPLNFPGAEASAEVRLDERRTDTSLRLRTSGLPANETFEVWLWDTRFGGYIRTTNLFFPSSRNATLRTNRGAPLPSGILDPEDLRGLPIRIYLQGGGIAFEGTLPNF